MMPGCLCGVVRPHARPCKRAQPVKRALCDSQHALARLPTHAPALTSCKQVLLPVSPLLPFDLFSLTAALTAPCPHLHHHHCQFQPSSTAACPAFQLSHP